MKKLPNTALWQPRKDSIETLKDIFYKRCLHVESLIISKAKQEKEFNIDNFDSGIPIEEIIREEFSKILPKRYSVTKGIVNDRQGFTAGEQDFIIFNNFWFPDLKSGAAKESKRIHFPIEGVYAIGEIKQTLTIETLDNAMEKLVIGKRLKRPMTGRTRIAENREINDCIHESSNPLYSFIIGVNLDVNLSMDDIFVRFFEINKQLKRSEIINSLCVLAKGTIIWCYFDDTKLDLQPEKFTKNTGQFPPIIPVLLETNESRKCSLYDLVLHLSAHLYDTILGGEDMAAAYGNNYNHIKIPPKEKYQINPE
ncbi:DUF6602 domain-containing protein [Ferruginibacter sp.]|nr:hypothetical protein [Ferruginibacter sp.]